MPGKKKPVPRNYYLRIDDTQDLPKVVEALGLSEHWAYSTDSIYFQGAYRDFSIIHRTLEKLFPWGGYILLEYNAHAFSRKTPSVFNESP